jgi:hypothetical protein
MDSKVLTELMKFTHAVEGPIRWMYLDDPHDAAGNHIPPRRVTVGSGFMIDPIESYVDQYVGQFKDKNTSVPASRQAIIDEFNSVNGQSGIFGWRNFEAITQLRLTDEFIQKKAIEIAKSKEHALKYDPRVSRYFTNFETFPPDAQLACVSRAYGRIEDPGSSITARNYYEAIGAQDWLKASDNVAVKGWFGSKNNDHQIMFLNADTAVRILQAPNTLFWPQNISGRF